MSFRQGKCDYPKVTACNPNQTYGNQMSHTEGATWKNSPRNDWLIVIVAFGTDCWLWRCRCHLRALLLLLLLSFCLCTESVHLNSRSFDVLFCWRKLDVSAASQPKSYLWKFWVLPQLQSNPIILKVVYSLRKDLRTEHRLEFLNSKTILINCSIVHHSSRECESHGNLVRGSEGF